MRRASGLRGRLGRGGVRLRGGGRRGAALRGRRMRGRAGRMLRRRLLLARRPAHA